MKNHLKNRVLGLTMIAASTLLLAAGRANNDVRAVDQPEIRRDGVGDKRLKLNALELKPFDVATLSKLGDWKNGPAPTAETLKDKVVALVMWANWREPAVRALSQLADLQTKRGGDGLVVIAVHDQQKWAEGTKLLEEKGIKVLSAHDVKGEFRAALMSEQNPDVYFIDRAGQLRFADVELASVEKGALTLLSETAEEAGKRNAVIAEAARKAKEEAARTREAKGQLAPGERIGKVPFKMPDASAYEGVLWPLKVEKEVASQMATEIQGTKWAVEFGQQEDLWMTPGGVAPNMEGKIVIVWCWATEDPAAEYVSARSRDTLEDVAKRFRNDVVIVAVNSENTKIEIERFLRKTKTELSYLYDTDKKVKEKLGIQKIPTVFVMSTDGTVRWMGHPQFSPFQEAVEQMVNRDPGCQARRKAEADSLRNRK